RGLVRRIGHDEDDVDDRLRRKARNGRRSGVLDQESRLAERGADLRRFALVEGRPLRVVVDEHDRSGRRLRAVDERREELIFCCRVCGHGAMIPYAAASSSAWAAPSSIVAATISNADAHADSNSAFHSSPAIAAIDAISTVPTTG